MPLLSKAVENRPVWYLDPNNMRRPKHHSWLPQEIKTAYALRQQGSSAQEIIDTLRQSLKKTQIYNIIRITRQNVSGRCYQCGHKLTETEIALENHNHRKWKRCQKCRQEMEAYKQSYRRKFLRRGLCGTGCGRNRLPGRVYCKQCLSLTQRQRNLKGLCGHCGRNPIDSTRSIALCTGCLDTNKEYSLNHRKEGSSAVV